MQEKFNSRNNAEENDENPTIYEKTYNFRRGKHGVVTAGLGGAIIGLVGLLGNYHLLPCQECFNVTADVPTTKVDTPPKPILVDPKPLPSPAPQPPAPSSKTEVAPPQRSAPLAPVQESAFVPGPIVSTEERQSLNAETKARVWISVAKENKFDADYNLVARLAKDLSDKGFKVAEDKSQAALLVEISNVEAQADQTGRRFKGTYNSEWAGSGSVTVRATWIKGKRELFGQQFLGQGNAGSEAAAQDAARDDAYGKIVERFLTLVKPKK